MSKEHNTELFALAVKMIREKRHTGLEIEAALEQAATSDRGVRTAVCEAQKYVKEMEVESFQAAVDAFSRGETQLVVERKLRALGFHSWDAMVLAGRAKAQAEKEMAEEAMNDGLSTLGGKPEQSKV